MNSHEQLYEKLNNVHASLRKEKEDAYRTKQLAEQRLQLARQDREAAEKKGNETQAQLRQLKERAAEMKGSNAAAEAKNKQMEKEFNFQHSELQGKKEKLSRLEGKRAIEANGRHCSITAAREMLRRLREDSSKNDAGIVHANISTEEKRRKLEYSMEVDGGGQLLSNFLELVKMRRERKAAEVKELDMKNSSLRRIIAGYQNALGAESIGQ